MSYSQAAPLSVADVYITGELARRAPRKTDYLQEKLAIQDLAGRMTDHPEEILSRLVDLALEMTGGVSAGLSLYEPDPAPGVFRWRYLRGSLAPFENATTPRNFSPCGITLDQNAAVLATNPERVYSWISEANIIVPEVLLVPLRLNGKEPVGTLWIVSEKSGYFDSGDARVMTELANFVGIALRMLQSEQQLQQALAEQEMLTGEIQHRIKNVFAMVDGMIKLTARRASSPRDMAESLSGRLHALASAHSLVRSDFNTLGAMPSSSDLGTLLRVIVKPHENADDNPRFSLDGPLVTCGERALTGVALVIYELATNAAKYGALTSDDGHIDIGWTIRDETLALRWVERHGPKLAAPPERDGFGMKLSQETVVRQLGGKLSFDWEPDGLVVTILLPLVNLAK